MIKNAEFLELELRTYSSR